MLRVLVPDGDGAPDYRRQDVEAFDARDAVGGVFLLQPIHLVPVQLCRPPRSQHAGPTESRTADRPACVGRRSARLAS
jgi:hypothetical protein